MPKNPKEWHPRGLKGVRVWTLYVDSPHENFIDVFLHEEDARRAAVDGILEEIDRRFDDRDIAEIRALADAGKWREAMAVYEEMITSTYDAPGRNTWFSVNEKRIR